MSAISCTSVCTSLHPVDAERSCESLACKHGCEETWAFFGSDITAIGGIHEEGMTDD